MVIVAAVRLTLHSTAVVRDDGSSRRRPAADPGLPTDPGLTADALAKS